ncbi:hypothetical protein [Parvibaculum sp.]|uniref:hypothetical protein n=1 Tax=Parvibaculum sp. TaxID=2024848 RepID=UPI00261440FC|nr:hypothetical protein [Parvibaculum sp.]MCW5728147.1 hypothetical protein [Parvibaculum sp.]
MSFVKDAELTLVVGRRGSGKSTLTKGLLKDRPKVLVFDPQAEYGGRGWVRCETRIEILRAMRKRWATGFKIAYVPDAGNEAEELHAVSLLCLSANAPYNDYADPRKLTLVVEEANLSIPSRQLPGDLNGIQRVINQGRHFGIEVIAVTQRPAMVSINFRGNVATSYVFPLAEEDDRDAMVKKMGKAWREPLRVLPNHSCLMHRDGHVTPMKVGKDGRLARVSLLKFS